MRHVCRKIKTGVRNLEENVMNKLPMLVPLLISLSGAISSNVYASEQTDLEPAFATASPHNIVREIDVTNMASEMEAERLLTKQLAAMEERLSADINNRFNASFQLRY
jgi:hypothetical protein|tara:strand:- start:335 stop:658 length:324 start_codon:yes stop_codon:yes gene_type:complete